MDNLDIISKYMSFLALNKLNVCEESAKDYCEMTEESLYKLTKAFIAMGYTQDDLEYKKQFFSNALAINPNSITAKLALLDCNNGTFKEALEALDLEYDRLLKLDYMNPIYYKDNIINFSQYQETYDYITGLRGVVFNYEKIDDIYDAIRLGEKLMELDPKDDVNYKLELSLYFMLIDDITTCFHLLDEARYQVFGAKELVLSYIAYKNKDVDNAIGHLNEMASINPFLYRIVTGEYVYDYKNYTGTLEDETCYFFLFFTLLIPDYEEYIKIIDESMKDNPIDESLNLDEKLIMETASLYDVIDYSLESIVEVINKSMLHECLKTYPHGRITGILKSLEARGLIENDKLTKLGEVYREHFQKQFLRIANKLKEEANQAHLDGKDELCIELINKAIIYAPDDEFLRMNYLFNSKEFDFDLAISVVHNLSDIYHRLDSDSNSKIEHRLLIIEALDEIHYKYYSEAYKQGLEFLIDAYQKLENQFTKYTYLIQMAQFLNGDIIDNAPPFYELYRIYKKSDILSVSLLEKTITKLEIQDIYNDTDRIPYEILDKEFSEAYVEAASLLPLDALLTSKQKDYVNLLFDKIEIDDIDTNLEGRLLERSLWLTYDEDGNTELEEFLLDYMKRKKENVT